MRPELKPGDIFFVMHHDHWLSKTIAWFMQSKFGHSGLILEQTAKRVYTLETTDFEVTESLFDRYENDEFCSFEVWRQEALSDDDRQAIMTRALFYDKAVYGYLQLLSFAVKRLLGRLGIRIPNLVRSGLVCCHVVLYGYQGSGVKGLDQADPEEFDTQELYEMVENSSMIKVYEKKVN